MPIVATITIPVLIVGERTDRKENATMRLKFRDYNHFMLHYEALYYKLQHCIDNFVLRKYGYKTYNDDFVSTHNYIEISAENVEVDHVVNTDDDNVHVDNSVDDYFSESD
jgi:hypothetical protein